MGTINGKTVTDSYAQEFRTSQQQKTLQIAGRPYHRFVHLLTTPCGCGAVQGQYHHLTCGAETCPRCQVDLEVCDCLGGG